MVYQYGMNNLRVHYFCQSLSDHNSVRCLDTKRVTILYVDYEDLLFLRSMHHPDLYHYHQHRRSAWDRRKFVCKCSPLLLALIYASYHEPGG